MTAETIKTADATANDLTIPAIVDKYKSAASIASQALNAVIAACKEGVTVLSLCALGDETINTAAQAVYNKDKTMLKGIAFPTCVSPNGILCHFTPIPSDPESAIVLKKDDMVRIELGAHVDGYIARAAHTLIVGASSDAPVTGRAADVLQAAHAATEAALRLLKPGRKNTEVTAAIQAVTADFDCTPVEGMLSHQLLRNVIDGEKQIVLNPSESQKKEVKEFEFKEGDVFSLDILISSGKGKIKDASARTTVYKRVPEVNYKLKMAASRATLTEVTKSFGSMAFGLRNLPDEGKARLGIVECTTHGLMTPYAVVQDKEEGEFVAHMVCTVLLLPAGPLKITGMPVDSALVQSEKSVQNEEMKELLAQPIRSKKAKKTKPAAADVPPPVPAK